MCVADIKGDSDVTMSTGCVVAAGVPHLDFVVDDGPLPPSPLPAHPASHVRSMA